MALHSLLCLLPALALLCSAPPQADVPLQRASPPPAQQFVKAFHAATPDKEGHITISIPVVVASVDEHEFRGVKGELVLAAPSPEVAIEQALKHPELRDRVEVRLTPGLIAKLKRLGIQDVAAHFQGREIRVKGKGDSTLYLCFPAVAVYTVLVERLEDIEVLPDAGPNKP